MTENTPSIAEGHVVTIHYTLKLGDGQEVDSSRGEEPLHYLHGHGNIVPGLEGQLAGRNVGDKLEVQVTPEDGYGPRLDEAVREVPLDQLPPGVEVGAQFQAQTESGEILLLRVQEVRESEAVVDFNHPLAGETLHFDIEVVAVRAAAPEELEQGHANEAGEDES